MSNFGRDCDSLNQSKTKVKAFTLAEVLITLAIIGVVAALAIPSVITNYKAKELETKNNKAKSILTNGFKLLLSNDGVTTLRDSKLISCDKDKTCISTQAKRVFNIITDNKDNENNQSFKNEYKFTSNPQEVWTDSSIPYTFITADGMIFGITPNKDSNSLTIIADLNGSKNPNKGAEDLCKYTINNNLTIQDQCLSMADWTRTGECSWENLGACDFGGLDMTACLESGDGCDTQEKCNMRNYLHVQSQSDNACEWRAGEHSCVCYGTGGGGK